MELYEIVPKFQILRRVKENYLRANETFDFSHRVGNKPRSSESDCLLKYTVSSLSFLSDDMENNAAPRKTKFLAKQSNILAGLANDVLAIYIY